MRIFGLEPAVIAYAVNAFVAMLVAWGLGLDEAMVDAISVITTALLAAVVAAMTRPVVVPTLAGAAATILTAFAAFGWDLSANAISTSVTAGSIVLALLLRQNVSPAPVVAKVGPPRA
jgi:hypothetical protein